ncbi:MAG: HAMP domain-containing histidine kinase [Thermoproteota archaeon]|nr:HAMP domain-containing histidine kinase [Thermoproteota archaeon]
MTRESAKREDPSLTSNVNSTKATEILYGADKAVGRGVQFMRNVKERMDIYFDHRAPSIVINVEEYNKGYKDIRRRGGKIRAFTEITKENIQYCKELMKLVDELRHLEGVKGGMAVSESEYMAIKVLEESKPLTEVIYSNVREVVEQGQYIFDTFWNSTIPAEQKIREIEGEVIRYRTRIIENPDEIIKEIGRITASSNKLDTCLTSGGLQYSHDYFFEIKKKVLEKQRRGQHQGIRYITNIDTANLQISKLYLDSGIQIRHIKNLPPMSFGVSDKEIAVTIEKMEGGRRVQSLLLSTEPLYVKHFTSLFEEIWRNGVDATIQIRNIEEGHELANVDVLPNSEESVRKAWTLVGSAKEEVLLMFATSSALRRQAKMGGLQVLIRAIQENRTIVKILIPDDRNAAELVEQINNVLPQACIRLMDGSLKTSITAVITDRKQVMLFELKDDTKEISYDAVGLALHIDSKTLALSYAALFDNLWKQTELYEKLEAHDKMQKEFINIAAHELRTPIQPILGLSGVLQDFVRKNPEKGYVDIILRNAKRLEKLTEDLLDVTRIESHSLNLNKDLFNLKDVILAQIKDYQKHAKDNGIQLQHDREDVIVNADKERITQVIANLIRNAITFTDEGGTISIRSEIKNDHVVISVTDTGSGISPEIYPKLFTKFATKSEKGTGLGLFISKSIIEAHGGRIWAQNNINERGATFSFTLPVAQSS